MKYNTTFIMAPLPLLLLLGLAAVGGTAATTNQAFACGFANWNGGGGSSGSGRDGEGIGLGQPLGTGSYDNGYYAGTQDAIYDHNNNLVYNPVGERLTCHSQVYWDGFRGGYDKQWNSYNYQSNSQDTSINIYGKEHVKNHRTRTL